MKALWASAGTSQPVLSSQQVQTVFYQVPEIRDMHHSFCLGLKARLSAHCQARPGDERETNRSGFELLVGDLFLKMVSSQVVKAHSNSSHRKFVCSSSLVMHFMSLFDDSGCLWRSIYKTKMLKHSGCSR